MQFCFYPNHEHGCPKVSHCPHLGGAALGTLVLAANVQELSRRALLGTIDAERQRNDRLFEENQRLQRELDQVKLELKLERQNKFATSQQKHDSGKSSDASDPTTAAKKKRGAPVGHPGWFRKTPPSYDWVIDVAAPAHCPHLRSTAIYLRNVIGISYRKIPQAIQEMFGIAFTPAALIGFETLLADKAVPIVDDVAKKLGSSDGPVHADETYWTLNGKRAYFWVHGDERCVPLSSPAQEKRTP